MTKTKDDPIDEMIKKKPLILFSLYSCIQAETLERVAKELNEITSGWKNGEIFDSLRAYDLFYLWVLGAYEWARTLRQNKRCFSESFCCRLDDLHSNLKALRTPFAKQELAGGNRAKSTPVFAELSVVGFDRGMKFVIEDRTYNSRDVTSLFLDFYDSIDQRDILHEIPINRPNALPLV